MVAAGVYHTVLLRSDGTAVAFGADNILRPGLRGCLTCLIPVLPRGLTYTQVAAGHWHTVLLRSDGTAFACGLDGYSIQCQCRIPSLPAGVIYTNVAAGQDHTVLLKSDGTAVAFGCDNYGQCQIPPLEAGITYTHAAAGLRHTVLLQSDGTAVAVGGWRCRRTAPNALAEFPYCPVNLQHSNCCLADQCKIPPLEPGVTYTQVAAGHYHTVLLKSNGTAIAFGEGRIGCLRIPELEEGVSYTQVAAGLYHTVLLRSDGRAVAIQEVADSQPACAIPTLETDVTYTQVAAGRSHTVLLKSDGSAIAVGFNNHGQCLIPALEAGVTYMPAATLRMRSFQADFQLEDKDVLIRLLEMSGHEYSRLIVSATERLDALQKKCAVALAVPTGAIVLPQGELLCRATLRNPATRLEELLYASKRRRLM